MRQGPFPRNAALQIITPDEMPHLRYSLSLDAAVGGPLAAVTIWWGPKACAGRVRRARVFV
jgi:hypothetical protein